MEKLIPKKYTKGINIQKYYTHKNYDVNDSNGRSIIYENNRFMFIKYMKLIWALYSLTINFESFKLNLQNLYFVENVSNETEKELSVEIVEYIKNKYYTNNNLNEGTDFDNLTNDYIYQFYKNNNIYSSHIEISIFKRMFMEPITDSNYINEGYIIDTSFKGNKFFIDYDFLTNIKKDNNYKKENKNSINEHNISIINENNDHFLLCLYEDEMLYDFDDKGEIIANKLLV